MADYININGNNIPIRASDPSNPIAGEIWYNLTTNQLKGHTYSSGAWSSGGTKNVDNFYRMSAGTQTAAILAGGRVNPPQLSGTQTETYDGTTWSPVSSMPVACDSGNGIGSQTAMLIGGASSTAPVSPGGKRLTTDLYDGTWTTGPNRNNTIVVYYGGAGGPAGQTAGLVFGGDAGGPLDSDQSEEWNGSSWTTGNNLLEGAESITGFGTQTAAVALGGYDKNTTSRINDTQLYDGTCFSAGNGMIVAGNSFGTGGTQALGLAWGGSNPTSPPMNGTYGYDGTSWTTFPATIPVGNGSLATGQVGTQGTSLAAGQEPIFSTATLEWNSGPLTVTFSNS